MLRSSNNTLLFLVVIAALAASAYGFCHCELTCPDGDTYYTSLNGTCATCDNNRCYNEWLYLENRCHTPCTVYPGCRDTVSCGEASDLAVGIIAAIVIGVVLLVIFAPLLFCFCMGVACFAGRRQRSNYQVVHTYGTPNAGPYA